MSAQPIDPDFAKLAKDAASDPAFQEAAKAALSGGTDRLWGDIARFAPLGAAAMLARILMSQEPVTFGYIVRRMAAAGITSVLVGFAVQDYIHSEGLRFAAIGMCGYCAPELCDAGLRFVKAKAAAKVAQAEAQVKGNRKTVKKK
jgi:hypothetical protein